MIEILGACVGEIPVVFNVYDITRRNDVYNLVSVVIAIHNIMYKYIMYKNGKVHAAEGNTFGWHVWFLVRLTPTSV